MFAIATVLAFREQVVPNDDCQEHKHPAKDADAEFLEMSGGGRWSTQKLTRTSPWHVAVPAVSWSAYNRVARIPH